MIKNLEKSKSFLSLKSLILDKKDLLIDNIYDEEIAFVISYINQFTDKNILLITDDKRKDLLYENLNSFNKNLLEFLAWETMPFEDIKPSKDILGKRFEVLNELITSDKNKLVLSTFHSLLQKTISKENFKKNQLKLKVDDTVDFDTLIELLVDLGYEKVSLVSDKGQFAIRGYIIDIFTTHLKNPHRIEFFSDEIESIRAFDIKSQKSIEKVDSIDVFLVDEMKYLKEEKSLENIFSYFEKDFLVIFDDLLDIENSLSSLNSLNIQNSKYFLSFKELIQAFETKQKIYFSENKIEKLSNIQSLNSDQLKEAGNDEISFSFFNESLKSFKWLNPFDSLQNQANKKTDSNVLDCLNAFIENGNKICFLTKNETEKKHTLELLENKNIFEKDFFEKNIFFENFFLSSGFFIKDINQCIIPYNEITQRKVLRRQKFREGYHVPIAEYHDLQINDLVVHLHSGIGKYLGCEKQINHLGQEVEFLIIEYAKNSKLYVPISQAHLVTKYIGSQEEKKPDLTELGSKKWQKTKVSAQKQIIGYAADLLNIQAQREIEKGFEYPKDSEETQLFDLDFPYVETKDQLLAIEDIKKDMFSDKAMDRLILADVGFGKTEIAMRAAFKAVYDGKKQVAVLVPTTVLAMQHYDTFKERMASFAINIDVVSRFKTTKENKKTLEDTKDGKVDILIGTHRLLSKDVFFKNLGLLVIDEEQRFGVRAKEHLKKLKKNLDCLTLSATPIPRTLYMSLIKIKDMSVINTPPQDRLPIKTIIAENDLSLIKTAILRELSRQGQIFFIHNRVETIKQRLDLIQKELPNLKAQIVHGQMDSNRVDEIFHQFKKGEIDILFATTIVENGIDVPNANTIIIDRADTFGLADLYQLRGRVGRWNRTAYAYFLTPKNKEILEVSQKRLKALLESSGFGSGMNIAMKDLEIRGAGDILGVKQSGQISNIGFHLYCKLLKKAILSMQSKKQVSFVETKMEFSYSAYIPEDYISDSKLRMEIYYRLGDANQEKQIDEMEKELLDRFGKVPQTLKELLMLTKIKIFANHRSFLVLKFSKYTLYCERQDKNKKVQKTLSLPRKDGLLDFERDIKKLLLDSFQIS